MPTTTNNGWSYPSSTDLVKDGATNFQTLATGIDTSAGKSFLAWVTWAPTLSGGWANGNGTYSAQYVQIGKTIIWNLFFTVGTTTTKGSGMTFSLPVAATSSIAMQAVTGVVIVASNAYPVAVRSSGGSTMAVSVLNTGSTYATFNAISGTTSPVPALWATGDSVRLSGIYEAA